jgi:hypothetical protein
VQNTSNPGPKPDFLVVEDHLKCQTNEGEVSLDLRIPIKRIESFMDMSEVEGKDSLRFLLDRVLWPEDTDKLENMRDGAVVIKILARYSEELGERMGADMGESKGSTNSSGSTVEPSAMTSGLASE